MLAVAPACAPELQTSTIANALESENALSMNALSMNALSMNALSMNALSMNGLDLEENNELVDTSEGRHVLKYIIRCALPSGASLDGEDAAGGEHTFYGLLGLAPDWEGEGITTAEAELVSACLLAHVNYFGISVAISARHANLAVDQDELTRFTSYEGAFFGDLFADPPLMYTCTGDAAPDFSVSYPSHDTTAGDRLLRRCTDVDGVQTSCGFINVGACSAACTAGTNGTAGSCYTGPAQTGTMYSDAVTIWLLEHDDVAASWPGAYDTYYGP